MFVRQLRKAASGCALGKRGVVTISPEVTSFLQTNTTKVNWSKFKHLCSFPFTLVEMELKKGNFQTIFFFFSMKMERKSFVCFLTQNMKVGLQNSGQK